MDPEQRQRIIGYFLEESQEYLELLEPGVQDLNSALADPERINELYRAAHSIKGGAAMLELHGIQKVAYRLESSLKFIKNNPLNPNDSVESKLLQAVEGLKHLTAEVRNTSDLSEESSAEVFGRINPLFDELDGTLEQLAAAHSTEEVLAAAEAPLSSEAEILLPPTVETNDEDSNELSWGDLEDLSDLSDLNTPESSSSPLAGSGSSDIEGLDELANLFDDNESDDWNLETPSPSTAAHPPSASDAAQALEALFEDDLLGSPAEAELGIDNLLDLNGEETTSSPAASTPSQASTSTGTDDLLENLDELFGDEFAEPSTDVDSLDTSLLVEESAQVAQAIPIESLTTDESIPSEPQDTELESLFDELTDEASGFNHGFGLDGTSVSDFGGSTTEPSILSSNESADNTNLEDLLDDASDGEALDSDKILNLFSEDEDLEPTSEASHSAAEDVSLDGTLLSLDEATPSPSNTEPELFSEDTLASLGELPALEETSLTDELELGLEPEEVIPPEPSSREENGQDDSAHLNDLDLMLEEAAAPPSQAVLLAETENTQTSADTQAAEDLNFDDLDSFLNDVEAESAESEFDDDFDDLDSLLEDAPAAKVQPAPVAEPAAEADADFADMDQLLQEAQSIGGGTKAAPVAVSPTSKGGKRSQRLVEQTMRVPVKTLDNLSNLVGEMVVTRNSLEGDQERLRQALDKLSGHTNQLSDVGQQLQDLYERSLLENALLNSRRKVMGEDTPAESPSVSSIMDSVDGNSETSADLDDLELDRFSSFHTLSQDIIEMIVRIKESTDDIDFLVNESLDLVARNFRQTTSQLQEDVNRSRMIPFSQTADRLPRAVRDISRKCGKDATLTVDGRDTLVDKMLVEQLHDPLTHLINNAVTHGIETQDERILAGKPPAGNIRLQAFYQGNQTVISIADDGAGIDPDVVKRKAIQKGLVRQEEADSLNEAQIYDFLFHAGFSTRDKADAFAGRGVGMDVVRTRLQELRGTIVTDSEVGKGTTFTIRLPLTLSITKALHCISNRARIAFPFDGVEDMFDIPREQLVDNDEGQPCIQWRDMLLPVRSLSDLLKYNRTIGRSSVYAGTSDEDMLALVILRGAGEYLAVSVDRVEGEMDIVIKQLEGPVPKPAGIAGATVLADGQVMPIADVLELIDISKGRARQGAPSMWDEESTGLDEPTETPVSDPLVLIVDDSITVRELLSMSFAKAGYRVEQARDGQEAWEKLRSGLPCDLVFCDIEMPRMTGLELLERLQKDEYLNTLPIAMLTSRGADRHRSLAAKFGARGYFTKPYLEESLLEAAGRLLKGEVLMNQPAEPDKS